MTHACWYSGLNWIFRYYFIIYVVIDLFAKILICGRHL